MARAGHQAPGQGHGWYANGGKLTPSDAQHHGIHARDHPIGQHLHEWPRHVGPGSSRPGRCGALQGEGGDVVEHRATAKAFAAAGLVSRPSAPQLAHPHPPVSPGTPVPRASTIHSPIMDGGARYEYGARAHEDEGSDDSQGT